MPHTKENISKEVLINNVTKFTTTYHTLLLGEII